MMALISMGAASAETRKAKRKPGAGRRAVTSDAKTAGGAEAEAPAAKDKEKPKEPKAKDGKDKELEAVDENDDLLKDSAKEAKPDARKKAMEEQIYREPFYKYKINTTLGVNVLKGNSALLVGAQFAYGPDPSAAFYVGPEITFSKFTGGSLLLLLAGAWYETRIYQSPRLFLAGGMLLGAGFSGDLSLVHRASFAFYAEGVIGQDISDLFSIRAQLRPGFVDGYFSYQMNLNVQFRFQ